MRIAVSLTCFLFAVLLSSCMRDPKALATCRASLEKNPPMMIDKVKDVKQTGIVSIDGTRGISGSLTIIQEGQEKPATFKCMLDKGEVVDMSVEYNQ